MRTCKKCGVNDSLPGRRECRECQLKRYRGYYREKGPEYSAKAHRNYLSRKARGYYDNPENRVRIRAGHKKVASKLRRAALDHYGAECACCGETIERFLTIDHVNNDGKMLRLIHKTGVGLYRWLRDNKYPDFCRVLCFNCNIGRAMNGGICPHKEGSTVIP